MLSRLTPRLRDDLRPSPVGPKALGPWGLGALGPWGLFRGLKMGTVKHLTQGERAAILRRRLRAVLTSEVAAELHEIGQELDRVVGEAQNGPPDGEADGSLVPPEWSKCQEIAQAIRDVLTSPIFGRR